MITDSLGAAASENLKNTYFELGRATAKSQQWEEPGFKACVGEIEHPICNFATHLDLDPTTVERLARVALDRPVFNVYALPQDKPRDLQNLLLHGGFNRTIQLVQMVAGAPEETQKNNLGRASTQYDRMEISLFMVDQFFTKQSQPFRRQVAEATAGATSLELLAMKRDGRILAAALVCFDSGMAGVYNLCVESSLRGLGIGSSVVREILAVCAVKQVPATLQCDPKLEGWYQQFGFKRSGEVDVYSLPRPEGFVIMQ